MVGADPPDPDTAAPVQPTILPDGLQLAVQLRFDERATSTLFSKWLGRLERRGIDPATSRICLHLAEEMLSDRGQLKMLGLADSGVQIPQNILDAIAAKNAPDAKQGH